MTPLSGRDDPYHLELKWPGRISASLDRILQAFLVRKAGHDPPPFIRKALSQTKTCGERQNDNFATSPLSTHPHKAAHLGSGLGIPDLHELVVRPAGGELRVRRESDR